MSRMGRRFTIGGISTAVVAIAAVTAAAALAAHSGHQWEVNGSTLTNGQTQTVQCDEKQGPNHFAMTGDVLGTSLKVTAGQVECLEAKVTQDVVGEAGAATDSGKLKFSELSVDEPAGCGVKSPIETVSLQSELVTKAVTSGLVDTLKPASGTTLMSITLTGCAAAETYPVKGSLCGEIGKLGTMLVNQLVKFNTTVDKACTADGLTVGGKAGALAGELEVFLSGANAGKQWGATAF